MEPDRSGLANNQLRYNPLRVDTIGKISAIGTIVFMENWKICQETQKSFSGAIICDCESLQTSLCGRIRLNLKRAAAANFGSPLVPMNFPQIPDSDDAKADIGDPYRFGGQRAFFRALHSEHEQRIVKQ